MCTDKGNRQANLNEWLDLVRRVGSNLNDENLRLMLLKIIPYDYRVKIQENASLNATGKIIERL